MLDDDGWQSAGLDVDCRWRIDVHPPGARLVVAGELDVASTPVLAAAVERVRLTFAVTLAVDLVAVSFADSTALNWLLGLHRRCRNCDTTVLVHVAPAGPVSRLLALSGLDQVLNVIEDHPAHREGLAPLLQIAPKPSGTG